MPLHPPARRKVTGSATRLARAGLGLLLSTGTTLSWGGEAVEQGGVVFQDETYCHIPFIVVWIDLDKEALELFWKRPDGSAFANFHGLRDWLRGEGRELVVATNSGIYAEDRTPLGLHIEGGETLRALNPHKGGKGNFALKPNGVFYIDASGAHIETTEDYAEGEAEPTIAVQSGPLLVVDNALHPKFEPDSTSVYIRNGIGVASARKVAIVVTGWPVNLHTFASFFKEVLGCPNALYLDGSLSGLYAPGIDRTAAGTEYVGILAVTRARTPEAADE